MLLLQLLLGDFSKPLASDWAEHIDDALLREDIRSCVAGSVLMPGILSELLAEERTPIDPTAPKPSHFPGKAKRVIDLRPKD